MQPDPLDLGERVPDRDEAAWIEAARAGDATAFASLVRRHYHRVWRIVWRIVRDEQEAEAVVQEVFVTARRSLPAPGNGEPFSTWLARLATSKAGSSVQSRRPRVAPDRPLKPERKREHLDRCFDRLDPELRTALAVQLEGAGYEEIARVLSIPIWTVRSRILRARLALSACMLGKRIAHG